MCMKRCRSKGKIKITFLLPVGLDEIFQCWCISRFLISFIWTRSQVSKDTMTWPDQTGESFGKHREINPWSGPRDELSTSFFISKAPVMEGSIDQSWKAPVSSHGKLQSWRVPVSSHGRFQSWKVLISCKAPFMEGSNIQSCKTPVSSHAKLQSPVMKGSRLQSLKALLTTKNKS